MREISAVSAGGDARVAVITGQQGIGKTRLAEELATRARARGFLVGFGRCWSGGASPPLWPWQAILRELESPDRLLAAGRGDTPQHRFARFIAVLDHFRALAKRGPLLIVLDDAHVADAASLALARLLVREGRGLPLLLVLTRREDGERGGSEAREVLAELERDAVWIALHGLGPPAIEAYLGAAGVRALTPEALHAVASITRGVPLHLRTVANRSSIDGDVIGGLERAIRNVLARLPGPVCRLVAIAAVLGDDAVVEEVAAVSGAPAADVAEALAQARVHGLVGGESPGPVRFVHDLVRDTAAAVLPLRARLEVHAAAAATLVGSDPARMVRRAHHALAAAARSRADAQAALDIALETARALRAADDLRAAAALLRRAVDVHGAGGMGDLPASVLAELADATLACGRLAESRPLFQRAAAQAEAEGDVRTLARAALGLGGFWLREHRLTEEAARVRSLQQRALAGLAPDAAVLRARLAVRLAAEEAYAGGPIEPVFAALEAVRATGDSRALAEALSLCHHAALRPDYTRRRLALVEEMIAAAVAAGDTSLTLVGLCWRAADLLLAGDRRAPTALEELRMRAEALDCRSVLFIVRAIDVMLAIRAGRFVDAEVEAERCHALGQDVGDADALAYHAGHLVNIRLFQGREAELADLAASIAASPTLISPRERSFALASALFALRAGRPEAARAALRDLRRDGLASVPLSSSWLASMLAVVELAADLDDAVVARAAHDALLPFADQPIMASLAVVCFGSARRLLGVAAVTAGEMDLAVEHLALAVRNNEAAGHRPAAIQARAELGLAKIRRAAEGDAGAGRALVVEAIADAEAHGMAGLAARWRAALDAPPAPLGRGGDVATLAPGPPGYWRVAVGGDVATVVDRIGLHYLARLVASPDEPIEALALIADHGPPAAGRHVILDRAAIASLRARIGELREERSPTVAEELELEELTEELGRALGLGGRFRSFADAHERARTAVRKAIKRAIDHVAAVNPAVGRHLAARVSTGATCVYRTADPTPGVLTTADPSDRSFPPRAPRRAPAAPSPG